MKSPHRARLRANPHEHRVQNPVASPFFVEQDTQKHTRSRSLAEPERGGSPEEYVRTYVRQPTDDGHTTDTEHARNTALLADSPLSLALLCGSERTSATDATDPDDAPLREVFFIGDVALLTGSHGAPFLHDRASPSLGRSAVAVPHRLPERKRAVSTLSYVPLSAKKELCWETRNCGGGDEKRAG